MKTNRSKLFILLFFAVTLFTCIDPYSPKLDKFQSLLVVDALVTDEDISNYVYLSRTKSTAGEVAEKVTGATVIIKDDLGNSTTLTEFSAGEYKTDSLYFRGVAGRYYILYIETADGADYESESCCLYPSEDIDSIYYIKDNKIKDNETREGISIYVHSKGGSESNLCRWTYKEYWKFNIPSPKRYNYVSGARITPVIVENETCWKKDESDEIIIKSSESGASLPLLFRLSDETDRFTVQYCIMVRQLSVSKSEYEFWSRMKQVVESGGDIFDKQPFQINGNIHNINDNEERVLGYFQVSAVKEKLRYITKKEIDKLDLPMYRYDCKKVFFAKEDLPRDYATIPDSATWDDVYRYGTYLGYTFQWPIYSPGGAVISLAFATKVCSDCSLTGNINMPYFWTDL